MGSVFWQSSWRFGAAMHGLALEKDAYIAPRLAALSAPHLKNMSAITFLFKKSDLIGPQITGVLLDAFTDAGWHENVAEARALAAAFQPTMLQIPPPN